MLTQLKPEVIEPFSLDDFGVLPVIIDCNQRLWSCPLTKPEPEPCAPFKGRYFLFVPGVIVVRRLQDRHVAPANIDYALRIGEGA